MKWFVDKMVARRIRRLEDTIKALAYILDLLIIGYGGGRHDTIEHASLVREALRQVGPIDKRYDFLVCHMRYRIINQRRDIRRLQEALATHC